MSWKAEVQADGSGEWASNGLRFAHKEEAMDYGKDLAWRWTLVREMRVVEVDEPVTHEWRDGRVSHTKGETESGHEG